MKKWILAAAAAASLFSLQAQSTVITTTGSITVENGSFVYDPTGYGSSDAFAVFGAEDPAANWYGSFDITSLNLDGMPPAFDQIATWAIGASGSVLTTGNNALGGNLVIDDLSADGAVREELGSFAMNTQFTDPAIADYSDVFGAFLAVLGPNPAGPAPTIADIFNAAESITSVSLLNLVSGLFSDPQVADLAAFASTLKIGMLDQDTVVFVSSAGLPTDLTQNGFTDLNIAFNGTAYLEAQFVSAPAMFSLFLLAMGAIALRRKA